MTYETKIRVSAFILLAIAFCLVLLMLGISGAFAIGLLGTISGAFNGIEIIVLFGFSGIALFILGLLTVAHVVAGYGLLKERPWARKLAIGLSALLLFIVPLGTAAGGFIMLTLLGKHTTSSKEKQLYAA